MVVSERKDRLQIVDILRGFALFGIMFINLMTFRPSVQWTGIEHIVDQVILILFQSKFLTIFSLLFGLSFALQVERAHDKQFTKRYVRRMIGLLIIGAAHYVLLWEGDILMYYVPAGLALLFFRQRRSRTLLIVGILLLLSFIALTTVLTFATAAERAQETSIEQSSDMRLPIDWYEHASYGELVRARLQLLPERIPLMIFGSIITLYLFLLGAYTARRHLFHKLDEYRTFLRQVAIWGIPIGLLGNAIVMISLPTRNQQPAAMQAVLTAMILPSILFLALGYIAAVTLLSQQWRWLNILASVGRLSLTNYLMQTLILTTLFYCYGLGWFGQVEPTGSVMLVLVIYSFQVVFSMWWIKRFRYGPAEWLWRSFTYWKFQPIRIDRIS